MIYNLSDLYRKQPLVVILHTHNKYICTKHLVGCGSYEASRLVTVGEVTNTK